MVELVGWTGTCEVVVNLIIPSHHSPLAGIDRERLATAGHFALSVAHCDNCGLRICICVDAVFAGLADGECHIRCVHLEDLALREIAEADGERAFGEADLDGLIVEIQKLEAGLRAEAQGRGADVKLGSSAVADPNAIADGEGPVDVGVYPVLHAGGLERNRAGPVVEAAHPARGVLRH
ncbi:MAG TPA: hypothetical protein VGK29_19010 [Paludibaculum sp.]